MMTEEKQRLSSKEGRANQRDWAAQQALINRSIGQQFLSLAENIAWHGGYRFTGIIIKERDDGYMATIKARRNGQHYVAFVWGPSYAETVELVGDFSDKGLLAFITDKYAPRR